MHQKRKTRRSYGTGSLITVDTGRRHAGTTTASSATRPGGRSSAASGRSARRTSRTGSQVAGRGAAARPDPTTTAAVRRSSTPARSAAAADAWLTHLEATGVKASSVRAYRAALNKWFLPTLKTRSLDRVTMSDIEHAMRRMRTAGLSDKTIRNYVGVVRALFNFAIDKRRRWTSQNPAADVDLPRAPTLHRDPLPHDRRGVGARRRGPTGRRTSALDRAMYLTAAMTGLRDRGAAGARLARRRLRPRAHPRPAHLGPQGEDVHHAEVPPLGARHPDARRRRRRRSSGFPTQHPDAVEPRPRRARVRRPRRPGSRWGTAACTSGSARRSRLRGSTRRTGSTACGTATGRRSPRRGSRCARCRSGWAIATSRRLSGTPTTARTPASATSSRLRSREVPIRVPNCRQLNVTQTNSARPTARSRAKRHGGDRVRVPPPELHEGPSGAGFRGYRCVRSRAVRLLGCCRA